MGEVLVKGKNTTLLTSGLSQKRGHWTSLNNSSGTGGLILYTLMSGKGALNKFEDVTLALSLQRKIKVLQRNWIALKVTGAIEMRT